MEISDVIGKLAELKEEKSRISEQFKKIYAIPQDYNKKEIIYALDAMYYNYKKKAGKINNKSFFGRIKDFFYRMRQEKLKQETIEKAKSVYTIYKRVRNNLEAVNSGIELYDGILRMHANSICKSKTSSLSLNRIDLAW